MTVLTSAAVGTFCWPELCSDDAAASKKFYAGLFGWEANDMHMPEGDYSLFKLGGQNVGGLYQMKDDRKKAGVLPHWNSYIAVSDADETAKKAASLGGKVLMQPVDAGKDTRMANLQDPTGVNFCIWQGGSQPEEVRLNELGALCWTELYTRDTKKSSEFYTRLFGWSAKPFDKSPMPYTIFNVAGDERMLGGMLEITKDMEGMQPQWLPYIMVENADKSAERAGKLGGKVHCEPMDIPTVGRMAILTDPQGAMLAIIKINSSGA